MRGRPRTPIVLTRQEREALRRLSQRGTEEVARRASIVLLSASGLANTDVAAQIGVDEKTVGKWRRKFLDARVDGLASTRPAPTGDASNGSASRVPSEVSNDLLVSRRRAAIVDAALELFRHKGYGATSVSEIAELAGLPIGTLYRYVNKKSDILYLLALDLMPVVVEAIEEALAGHDSVEEKLRHGIRGYLRAIAQRRTHIKVMYWDTHWLAPDEQAVIKAEEERTRRLFETVLEQAVEAGVIRPVNILIAAENIILAGHAWALKGFMFKNAVTLDEYIEQQVELLMSGLAAPTTSGRTGTRRGA